jgi:hypothetical protein
MVWVKNMLSPIAIIVPRSNSPETSNQGWMIQEWRRMIWKLSVWAGVVDVCAALVFIRMGEGN